MAPKDHIIDDRLVDQVTDFDEARHSGHHSEDCHYVLFAMPLLLLLLEIVGPKSSDDSESRGG